MWEPCQNPYCSDCAGGSATPRGRKLLLGRALAVALLRVGIVLPPVSPRGSISPSYQYARAHSSALQLGSVALSSVFRPPLFFFFNTQHVALSLAFRAMHGKGGPDSCPWRGVEGRSRFQPVSKCIYYNRYSRILFE